MKTAEYLSQLRNIDRRIADKRLEAEKWREIAKGVQSIQTDSEKVVTSVNPDKMGAAVARAVDYEREADQMAEGLVLLRHHIIDQIDGIEDPEEPRYYNILKAYYLKGMTFTAIGIELNFSAKQVSRDLGKAQLIFEKMYLEEYKDVKNMSELLRHFRS